MITIRAAIDLYSEGGHFVNDENAFYQEEGEPHEASTVPQ
jgi:hypothetical protein